MSLPISDVLELVKLGFTADEIRAYASASDAPAQASAPVKAAKVNSFYAEVIVGKAGDRLARKALAHAMRSAGLTPNGAEWAELKSAFELA